MRKINIIGQVKNDCKIIDECGYDKHGRIQWKYKCKCGYEKTISSSHWKYHFVGKCRHQIHLTGQVKGNFTIIGRIKGERNKVGSKVWTYKCTCGYIGKVTQFKWKTTAGVCKHSKDIMGQVKGDYTIIKKVKANTWLYKCTCGKIQQVEHTTWAHLQGICRHTKDIVGLKITGRMEVVRKSKIKRGGTSGGGVLFECKCSKCGKIVLMSSHKWQHRKSDLCITCWHKRIDLTGARKGKLTVLGRKFFKNRKQPYWVCLCDCGKISHVTQGNLNQGGTISCGCLRNEIFLEKDIHKKHKMGIKNRTQAKLGNKYNLSWNESARIVNATQTINFLKKE